MSSIVLGWLRVTSLKLLLAVGLIFGANPQTTVAQSEDEDDLDEIQPAIVWLDAEAPTTDHPDTLANY